uniref:hypothetical protein n=1 Tax=Nocardia suismassiliense TaxID=2077092 RepID=UPI003F49582A
MDRRAESVAAPEGHSPTGEQVTALAPISHENENGDPGQPLTWQTVVLMLGLTSVCLLFAGVLITFGKVDPQQGTWCTVAIAVVLNGVVLNRRIGRTGAGHLRRVLTTLLDAGQQR